MMAGNYIVMMNWGEKSTDAKAWSHPKMIQGVREDPAGSSGLTVIEGSPSGPLVHFLLRKHQLGYYG